MTETEKAKTLVIMHTRKKASLLNQIFGGWTKINGAWIFFEVCPGYVNVTGRYFIFKDGDVMLLDDETAKRFERYEMQFITIDHK